MSDRHELASENSQVPQYWTPAEGASPLFRYPGSPGVVRRYMLLWAGEADAALTAGWLAIPIPGDVPLVRRRSSGGATNPTRVSTGEPGKRTCRAVGRSHGDDFAEQWARMVSMEPIWWVVIIATVIVSGLAVFAIYWVGEHGKKNGKPAAEKDDGEVDPQRS